MHAATLFLFFLKCDKRKNMPGGGGSKLAYLFNTKYVKEIFQCGTRFPNCIFFTIRIRIEFPNKKSLVFSNSFSISPRFSITKFETLRCQHLSFSEPPLFLLQLRSSIIVEFTNKKMLSD